MELEEAEDEEWETSQYWPQPNANNSGGKVNWVFNRGLKLGKQVLIAGILVSSAPFVLPPLVVASAIGLTVSMPYAFFLASHACTQNLMNKLLPRPNCEEDEGKVWLQKHDDVKNGAEIDSATMEGYIRGESNYEVQPMSDGNGVVTTIEGFDEIGNEIEKSETPFEVTIVLEESEDEIKEGDIEVEELQRETKGLLEKIRDEGRVDREGEYVEGNHGVINESDQEFCSVDENMEEAQEEKHGWGAEGEVRNEEDTQVCEEMLQSRNDDDNVDSICIEVELESSEPVRGFLDGKEVDNTNDLQKPMAEPNETIQAEPIGGLLLEMQVNDISVTEVTVEKNDAYTIFEEELKPLLDGPTTMQEGELHNNGSDFVNQETQLHEDIEVMDSSNADTREIGDDSGLHFYEEKTLDPDVHTFTIDLDEEPSNSALDGHTDSMEVLVLSAEQDSRASECSYGENTSQELVFNEGNIWKQIHAIRKITGYEGAVEASCADELKALYIFTGVEPPNLLKQNSYDPAEINEKLHFLMSIVGIKSNMA